MNTNETNNSPELPPQKSDIALVMTRSTFNLLIVGTVFFLVGIAVGALGYAQYAKTTEQLIEHAVESALLQQQETLTQLVENLPTQATTPTAQKYVDDDPAIGPKDAPVTIVEFSDFNCQYCKRFHDETLQPILEQYAGKIQFVYRDFPILGPSSIDAAVAAECANEQDAFWEYHDVLFANQGDFSNDSLIGYAERLDLNIEAFSACLKDPAFVKEVNLDSTVAQQIGARGTPAFLINSQFVSGAQPLDAFAVLIDQELALVSDS